MSVVNLYDNYPKILSQTDSRIHQLQEVDELNKTNKILIVSTAVLAILFVVLISVPKSQKIKRKKDGQQHV